ncbi:dihydroorotase [Chytriomyces sp. MP71]|nr:dihydroorotase [Chytriomyces sp. MP71]
MSRHLIHDLHIHLRQGSLMRAVAPHLNRAGIGAAFVMPNLKPPVTTTDMAVEYRNQLQALAPNVAFLMSLYLSPSLTPAEIRKAKKAGVVGVKSYPRGVTTNSEGGIESYSVYYDVFKAMEEEDMVLNLHGEVPSDHEKDICVLNAEEKFLTHLKQLHKDFPKLRIILEHATTKAAVDCVKSLGSSVACTITIHHLELVVDDWAGKVHNYCKPVAKYPHDRKALQDVVKEGHPRFFLGTDSAPHPRHMKETSCCAAGVYTGPYILAYLANALASFGAIERLDQFGREFGAHFYKLKESDLRGAEAVMLLKEPFKVPEVLKFVDDEGVDREIVPYRAGETLLYTVMADASRNGNLKRKAEGLA